MPEPVKVDLPEDSPSYFGVKEDCKGASCTVSGGRRRSKSKSKSRRSRRSRRSRGRRSRRSRRR